MNPKALWTYHCSITITCIEVLEKSLWTIFTLASHAAMSFSPASFTKCVASTRTPPPVAKPAYEGLQSTIPQPCPSKNPSKFQFSSPVHKGKPFWPLFYWRPIMSEFCDPFGNLVQSTSRSAVNNLHCSMKIAITQGPGRSHFQTQLMWVKQ